MTAEPSILLQGICFEATCLTTGSKPVDTRPKLHLVLLQGMQDLSSECFKGPGRTLTATQRL